MRQPKGEENDDLVVEDFLSLPMAVFNIGVEDRMVQREIRFCV